MLQRTLALTAAILAALIQTPVRAADPPPFELNEDRIKVIKEGNFESDTYFIPTVYLHVAARVKTEAKNEGASTKARVFVEGLDKALMQGLAKQVYDDLVTKVRAAGYKVLTYDDLKPELASMSRMEPNKKYGFPTKAFDKGPGIDFAIASPSDDQTFDYNFATGPGWPWRNVAKDKKLLVLIPQIYFNLPGVVAGKGSSLWGKSVSLTLEPVMRLYSGIVNCVAEDGGFCGINIQEHGTRLASDAVGTVQKLAEDTSDFGEWARTTADFAFVIDPAAFSDGVLRVGYAVNSRTVKTLKDSH